MNKVIKYLLSTLCLFVQISYGQVSRPVAESQVDIPTAYTYSADSLAFYINSHYQGDAACLKALYTWMTSNMKYNVYTTFESRNDIYSEEKDVRNTLKTRSGVCRNFALVFKTVSDAMDIPAFVIEGYVKDGTSLMTDPHAWCCAKVNGKWYQYDVTFGMGTIANNQFTSRPNMNYCQVDPLKLLENHMPFDPIWQLIERPYKFHAYDQSSSLPPASGKGINPNDSIRAYVYQTKVQQQYKILQRVRTNGTANPLVDYYLQLTESNIKVYQNQAIYDVYKKAIKSFNRAADLYNEFVQYRKAQFQPEKEKDEVMLLLTQSEQANTSAHNLLITLTDVPEDYISAIQNLQTEVMQVMARIGKHKAFVDDYYKASPGKRKNFFRN